MQNNFLNNNYNPVSSSLIYNFCEKKSYIYKNNRYIIVT